MKIRTPWKKSFLFKEYYYEIDDLGVKHTYYTKIFLLNWLLTLHDFMAKMIGGFTSSRGFFRWEDVLSYKIFEKEKAILINHRVVAVLPKYVLIVCSADNFNLIKNIVIKKAGKNKQVPRTPEDKLGLNR